MLEMMIGLLFFLWAAPHEGYGLVEKNTQKVGSVSGTDQALPLGDLEEEILSLINKERERLEVPPLTMDSLTQEVARSHSSDMIRRKFVGHETPEGKTLQDRLFERDVYASEYAENVAKHITVKGAHQGLMKSISHRKNILNPHFTHVGIGIIRGKDKYLYFTQNFIKKIERMDLKRAKEEILKRLNLAEEPLLTAIAEEHTWAIYESEDVRIPVPELQVKARIFTWRGPSLEALLEKEEIMEVKGSKIGVGILQESSRKHGTGLLWITLIIAY
ncbi:CAP domain-containing protein [candidate division TA06 bacterium]|nr:CAP domain-containing protein [candidate division TA06 bacterium]